MRKLWMAAVCVALMILVLASLFCAYGQASTPPHKPFDIDYWKHGPQWHLYAKAFNTTVFEATLYQGTNLWTNTTGYAFYFKVGKDRNSSSMLTINGVASGSTVTFTTPSTNTLPYAFKDWYSAVLVTAAGGLVHSYAEGYLTVEGAPEAGGGTTTLLTGYTLSGGSFANFTGSFAHWPFLCTDGSNAMLGNLNAGGYSITNIATNSLSFVGGSKISTDGSSLYWTAVGGSAQALLTNEPLWEAASNLVAYIGSTGGWTNLSEYNNDALFLITGGTGAWTNLSEYNNDSAFVTASITNGLASTNWVIAFDYYPSSNPSNFISAGASEPLWVAASNSVAYTTDWQATNAIFEDRIGTNEAEIAVFSTGKVDVVDYLATNGYFSAWVTALMDTQTWVVTSLASVSNQADDLVTTQAWVVTSLASVSNDVDTMQTGKLDWAEWNGINIVGTNNAWKANYGYAQIQLAFKAVLAGETIVCSDREPTESSPRHRVYITCPPISPLSVQGWIVRCSTKTTTVNGVLQLIRQSKI